jgi:hypothetical protein
LKQTSKNSQSRRPDESRDEAYLAVIRKALEVCQKYKPKFGGGNKAGYTLEEFRHLYQQDPFYSWFGLDSPLMYAAHKAAGGITSVYRQIGTACERLFQKILQDTLGLSSELSKWSYKVPTTSQKAKERLLSLDGRIPTSEVKNAERAEVVKKWLREAANKVLLSEEAFAELHGAVFEVRQGYKSKDSKRQNADVSNASNAYAHNYLPSVVLLSTQIDSDVAERYVRAQWVLLRGTLSGTPLDSTYVFCREILGYDLAAFFERHSPTIKSELEKTLECILT